MSESRQVLGRSPLHWAIVAGVSLGVSLGIAEFLWIDIQGIMPDYSTGVLLLSWGLLALIALVYRALNNRITALESDVRGGGVER